MTDPLAEPVIRGTRITMTDLAAHQARIGAIVNQLNAAIAEGVAAGVRIKVHHEEQEIPVRPWTLHCITVAVTAQPVIGGQDEG